MNAPTAPLGQELVKRSTDGRFWLFKKYRIAGGGHVRGATAPTTYSAHDMQTGKTYNLATLADVNCFIHNRLTGEECSPWFGKDKPAAPAAQLSGCEA